MHRCCFCHILLLYSECFCVCMLYALKTGSTQVDTKVGFVYLVCDYDDHVSASPALLPFSAFPPSLYKISPFPLRPCFRIHNQRWSRHCWRGATAGPNESRSSRPWGLRELPNKRPQEGRGWGSGWGSGRSTSNRRRWRSTSGRLSDLGTASRIL